MLFIMPSVHGDKRLLKYRTVVASDHSHVHVVNWKEVYEVTEKARFMWERGCGLAADSAIHELITTKGRSAMLTTGFSR